MASPLKRLISVLPVFVSEGARQAANRLRLAAGWTRGGDSRLRADPLAYTSPFAISAAIGRLKRKPALLLSSHKTRAMITLARFDGLTRKFGIRSVASDVSGSVEGTLKHNRDALARSVAMSRPEWIVYPLIGIEQIRRRRKEARALSVGPRGEYELFTLMGLGFRPENVYGLDLFSYSPMIEVGDMHDMPFEDDFFDVIVLGWVYSYSADWKALSGEVLRCARDRAIIAISADYSVPGDKKRFVDPRQTHVQNADDLLRPYGKAVKKVYFRQDADMPETTSSMVHFEITKPRG